MANINLYYHRELLKEKKSNKYLALPIQELRASFILEESKLNLYQEIVLELFKCGHSNIESINEVLNLGMFNKKEENEIEGLSHYLIKELKKLDYINNNNEITEKGNQILNNNIKGTKEMGWIFYNYFTKGYENFVVFDSIDKGVDYGLAKEKINLKNKNKFNVNLGTIGQPKEIEVEIVKQKEVEEIPNFTIEELVEVISKERYSITSRLSADDAEDGETLAELEKNKYVKEKRKLLEEIRKFQIYDKNPAYILVALKNGGIKTSINPWINDEYLKIEMAKNPILKEMISESLKIDSENSIKEKTEIKINFKNNMKDIINDSKGRLKYNQDLVKTLSDLSQLGNEENKEERYGKVITTIYKCFSETFLCLYEEYKKDKERNKDVNLKLKRLFIKKYQQNKDIVRYFSEVNPASEEYVKLNKQLKELVAFVCLLEEKVKEKKVSNFILNNPDFLEFIKKLIVERNKFSHSGEEQNYTEEEIEFDFEEEAKSRLIYFVEYIFDFKFKNSLKTTSIVKEQVRRYEIEAEKKLALEFGNYSTEDIWKELKEIYLNFKYYSDFKNNSYKSRLIKSIGILLEKNLKKIRMSLGKNIELDSVLNDNEKITLKEIDEKFFKNTNIIENKWINNYFSEILNIYISTERIKKNKDRFTTGTLNTYASALLYSKNTNKIKILLEKNMEFFKLVFNVSSLRGHNGEFNLIEENNSKKEIEEVKKLVDIVFEVERKLLELMEEN